MERLAAVDAGRIDATILTPFGNAACTKARTRRGVRHARSRHRSSGQWICDEPFVYPQQPGDCSFGAQRLRRSAFYIPRNREETRRITAKYMRTTDPEVLDATYDWFVKRVSKKPYPTLKGIQYLLDEVASKLPNAKNAKPEQFVDLSLLQQLEREGFFTEMAKRYP